MNSPLGSEDPKVAQVPLGHAAYAAGGHVATNSGWKSDGSSSGMCHLSKTIDNKQNDDDELVEVIQRVQLVVLFR